MKKPRLPVRRLTVLALLALALAPGTWLRSPAGNRESLAITVTQLPSSDRERGGFSVEGLWQLRGEGARFGGYSAMGILGENTVMRLFSDRGWLLTFPLLDSLDDAAPRATMRQLYPTGMTSLDLFDIEAATYDHAAQSFWLAYENRHVIHRYDMGGEPEAWLELPFAGAWSSNGGVEAMARLADGRFLLLRESGGEAYLFDGDPVEGADAMRFSAAYPEDYSPTDMAQLPDGRVLVVLRRVAAAYPVFEAMIGIADPADIASGEVWRVSPLVQLEELVPRENYEAIAVWPRDDGSVSVWLASDDNKSAFQRSLVAKLRFTPEPAEESAAEEAHEKGRRAEAGAP